MGGGGGGGGVFGGECVGISLVYMLKVFCPVSASAHISKVVRVMVNKSRGRFAYSRQLL